MNTKFIFVTGGVVSSLGKGIFASSLGALLIAYNFRVRIRKLDPYLNIDSGTMNPIQHGEVFVTSDGVETDLDLGYYERFTDVNTEGADNITSGKVYSELLTRERRGDYLGKTVQVIPHVVNLIKDFILRGSADIDFMICEIGGTVGDIEALPFLEAIRQIRYDLKAKLVANMHLTLLPYMSASNEIKTKPTQHSVRELRSIGIYPDFLICRSEKNIPDEEKQKIAMFCNVVEDRVIEAIDVANVYSLPITFDKLGLGKKVLSHFEIIPSHEADLSRWQSVEYFYNHHKHKVVIALIGKYISMSDAYKSLIEALAHGGLHNSIKVEIIYIDSREGCSEEKLRQSLKNVDGIVIPGAFGVDGIEGKINSIRFARENNVPCLGICMGMQLSVVEFARNVVGMTDVGSCEFDKYRHNIVDLIEHWMDRYGKRSIGTKDQLGGTMRLGSYECAIKPDTKAHLIYKKDLITERHRHRFEINTKYVAQLETHGMIFSGLSNDLNKLPEILEINDLDWFVGVQYHPELQSRPFNPHPLFVSFIDAALNYQSKKRHESE